MHFNFLFGHLHSIIRTFYSTHTYFCSQRALNPVQNTDLLHFFLRSTYFQYNGTIYKEREGVSCVEIWTHCEKAIGTLMALASALSGTRRSQEFRCLHCLLCGELAIQTLDLRPSKLHKKNNTQGSDRHCDAMHFK